MVKIVGACKDAATVCPTSTFLRDDDPVDRRADDRVVDIRPCDGDGRVLLFDLGLRLFDVRNSAGHRCASGVVIGLRELELLLRRHVLARESRDAFVVSLGLKRGGAHSVDVRLRRGQVRLRALEICRCLLQRSLQQRGFDQRDDVALVYARIEIDVQLGERFRIPAIQPARYERRLRKR